MTIKDVASETPAEWARRTAVEQGLPPELEDLGVINDILNLLDNSEPVINRS